MPGFDGQEDQEKSRMRSKGLLTFFFCLSWTSWKQIPQLIGPLFLCFKTEDTGKEGKVSFA